MNKPVVIKDPATRVQDLIVSPSQLSNHQLCPRKWWFKSVLKLPEPQSPGAREGSHAHTQMELRQEGKPYEKLPHVEALATFLHPPQTPGILIEQTITTEIAGVRMTGRIDVINSTGTYIDSVGILRESPGVPEIQDYKFGNKNYWLSGSGLREDVQINVYANALIVGDKAMFPDSRFIRLSHNYASRNSTDRSKVTILRTKDEIVKWRDRVAVPAVEALRTTAGCEDVSETRVNLGGCRSFGGCAYESVCTKRQGEQEIKSDLMASLMMTKDQRALKAAAAAAITEEKPVSDMFDKLLNKKKTGAPIPPPAATPPAASVATTPAPAPAPVSAAPAVAKPAMTIVKSTPGVAAPAAKAPASGGSLFSKLMNRDAAPAAAGVKAPAPAQGLPMTHGPGVTMVPKAALPVTQPVVQAVQMAPVTVADAAALMEEPTPIEQAIDQTGAVTAAEVQALINGTPPAVEEPKRKRGRPKLTDEQKAARAAENAAPAPAQAQASTPVPEPQKTVVQLVHEQVAVEEVAESAVVDDEETPGVSLNGRRLFIDCVPSTPAKNLEPYLGALCVQIAQDFGVPDIRCALNESPLSFGKWKGVLAARIRKTLPGLGAWYILGTRGDELKTILADTLALDAGTREVTRGM